MLTDSLKGVASSRRATSGTILSATVETMILFGGAAVIGFVGLVALFKAGVLGQIDILFYRGAVLCCVAAVLVVAGLIGLQRLWPTLTVRDAVAAGCLSFGLNLSFLVVAPVTVDRSVSVFMISTMAATPEQAFTTADIDAAFRTHYLDRMAQIDRRMKEQVASGTMIEQDGRYRLTAKGLGFMGTARFVAWLFDTDTKLLDQPAQPRMIK
jgi:hypothetical protein